jgi:hypothetical protein
MKKLFATCLACAAGILFPAAAWAEPGELWEITSKTEIPGVPMDMPSTIVQACLGKNGASDPHQATPSKDCKITHIHTKGNKTTWRMRCTHNKEVMRGSGKITFTDDSYQGDIHFKGRSEGHPVNMITHYNGKKLGDSCDTSQPPKQITESQQQKKKAKGTSSPGAPPADSGEALQKGAERLKGLFGL